MFLYGCLPLGIQKCPHARLVTGLSHGLAVAPVAPSLSDKSGILVGANTYHRLLMLCLTLAERVGREGGYEWMSTVGRSTAMPGTLMF